MEKTIIGWREWVALPELGIPALKAKMDTGARTSALHAFDLVTYEAQGVRYVRFGMHPLRRHARVEIWCTAPVVDTRTITNSGGQSEERIVIATPLRIGNVVRPVEVTLTNREGMGFRMLVGRTALENHFLIDSAASYVCGKQLAGAYLRGAGKA
ncbi:ATP-dependent zinc protease [Desulfobaculum sp. SPO524]|jgi:hypothetical protein|uniref:ATP-dependent zinc protease family protein n=1 Tax=Desulfobaculum sp. SPO524 TaxID=3378071 RepID=UPI003853BFA0